MDKVFENINQIKEWINNAPDIRKFKTNDDFMEFICELMSQCLYLLKVSCSLAPSEEVSKKGLQKKKAIVLGHLIRIYKLYEGALIHISNRQFELTNIFYRLIFETYIRMKYLIKSKSYTYKNFILISYKAQKEILNDLELKAKKRPLIQIEKRMKRIIKQRLKSDNISLNELKSNKSWNLDGKTFKEILENVWGDTTKYPYGYITPSHSVHGDWIELSYYHLKKEGRFYHPKLYYTDPDPRIACAITTMSIDAARIFFKWYKTDPNKLVSNLIEELYKLNISIDNHHEKLLGE